MVCCGYDEESRMIIVQNHWGTIWGLKGFFLCPYDVWKRQNNIICWYEKVDATVKEEKPAKKEVAAPKVQPPPPPKVESPKVESPKVEAPKVEAVKPEPPKVQPSKPEPPKVEQPKAEPPKAS